MVNQLHIIKDRVVKAEKDAKLPRVTAKGGLVAVQALARRQGLWNTVKSCFPARKDATQGFQTEACVSALVFGLLSGGKGFSATEPMRGDGPLLRMLGQTAAPSSETIEAVVKYVALEQDGCTHANTALLRQAVWTLGGMKNSDLRACGGFIPFWADGSLLEVEGKCFDAIKVVKGKRGQMCAAAFCGPVMTGMDFTAKGEGEGTVSRRLIDAAVENVLRPLHLMEQTLILLDSLYGKGPTLTQLESYREKPPYIVGLMGLAQAQRVMHEMPEIFWRDTGAQPSREWDASGVAQAWVQCEDWPEKRPMVCRRWRNEGEMIWNYAAVTTPLTENDARIKKHMEQNKWGFEETIWALYSHKQGMENQWKELLSDMGLHHPPCAKAKVNAVFYAIAGLAYNLAVGLRKLTLEGASRCMRLWRLRREMFDLAAYAVHHGRQVVVRFLDARDHLIDQLLAAMGRVARL
jgi:hypothetical protein